MTDDQRHVLEGLARDIREFNDIDVRIEDADAIEAVLAALAERDAQIAQLSEQFAEWQERLRDVTSQLELADREATRSRYEAEALIAEKDAALTGMTGLRDEWRDCVLDLQDEVVRKTDQIDKLTTAIHAALAHGDRTTLGTVRAGLADAVNELQREPPAPPEHLSGVNDDYYEPGKKGGA